jgi:hypothetical protein
VPKVKTIVSRKGKDNPDCGIPNHWSKHFAIVISAHLLKISYDQSSSKSYPHVIEPYRCWMLFFILLDFIDPFGV